MKKLITILGLAVLLLAACGSSSLEFNVENNPTYESEGETEIVLSVADGGEAVTGASISGTLEMERMDHGITTAHFSDNGDGTYTANVDLAMGGEWIMAVETEYDGNTHTETVTFTVSES